MRMTWPPKPLVRSASAALAPASPAPTMTNVCGVLMCAVSLSSAYCVHAHAARISLRCCMSATSSMLRCSSCLGVQCDKQIGERLVEAGDAVVFKGVPDVIHVDPHCL